MALFVCSSLAAGGSGGKSAMMFGSSLTKQRENSSLISVNVVIFPLKNVRHCRLI